MNLPDFPWDLLAPYSKRAKEYEGGSIDLSQGTPVDPVPDFIQEELIKSSNSPGYPLTIGKPDLREAIHQWAISELGVRGEFDFLPTIGSKELIAWLPTLLEVDSVAYPKIAYPTYLVGALIAKAKPIAVDIDADNWPKVELVWINSPSNPTGRVHTQSELQAVINYSRNNNAIVASDECYLPFHNYGEKPRSILSLANGDNEGLLAIHSLSKRSNLAGYRAGLIIGDKNLISKIREIRKHAGMLVPTPVQNAMIAALRNQNHVIEQVSKYNERRKKLIEALSKLNFNIVESGSGLYIWCTRGEKDWNTVEWFSERGIVVTPGSFYGEESGDFVRIALTATDENIIKVVNRILN